MVDRGAVRGVDLAGIVTATSQPAEVAVGEMLDERGQRRLGAEEMLADIGARLDPILLERAVDGGVHLGDQGAVVVAGEQVVPLPTPDDFDHVPARAAEEAFEFLDDLAVAPHGTVEALQVAVDDEDEVVESFPARQRHAGQALGLVHLAIAGEAPHRRLAGVHDAAIGEIAVEARLVGGIDRPSPIDTVGNSQKSERRGCG